MDLCLGAKTSWAELLKIQAANKGHYKEVFKTKVNLSTQRACFLLTFFTKEKLEGDPD